MIKFVASKMASTGWIVFLAMLLINQNTLGSLSFNPGTTWYEGFGPMHASEQEKVRNPDKLGRIFWQKFCSYFSIMQQLITLLST